MIPYVYTGMGHDLDEQAAWDYIRDGYLLRPRTVFKGRTKTAPLLSPAAIFDLSHASSLIQQKLEAALGPVGAQERAVMFSGGFDSILMAFLAKRCGAKLTAVTVAFDAFNPLTVAGASLLANQLGMRHHILSVSMIEFLSAFEGVAGLTDEPLLDLDLVIVYAALKKYDPKIAGPIFISGMGSDQWLGDEALAKERESFDRRLDWAIVDEQAHQKIAQAHGCRFVFPFLSEPLLSLSHVIPPELKKDKKLLRSLASAHGIPQQGNRSEVQVPSLVRQILIKTFGDRAWPHPVSMDQKDQSTDQLLRQIILGLWLRKQG